eukprot:scaffold107360_cov66-Phaeocystis_antarctica.AAC.2
MASSRWALRSSGQHRRWTQRCAKTRPHCTLASLAAAMAAPRRTDFQPQVCSRWTTSPPMRRRGTCNSANTESHEESDHTTNWVTGYKQSTPRAGEAAGAARLGRAALQNQLLELHLVDVEGVRHEDGVT